MERFESRLKTQARSLGFDLAGIAAATDADTFLAYKAWIDSGSAGEMGYLAKYCDQRKHPDSVFPGVRSVLMLAWNYKPADNHSPPAGTGRIASYARTRDYHLALREKLNELLAWVQAEMPAAQGRGVVDTAPLLERDFARRAGLGWFGKNTMLLNKKLGSFFFLAALLLNLELQPDLPFEGQHCGTCTRCLDACPTDAFTAPYHLDARKCISYLTIERKGPIDVDLRNDMGDWIFGCDICQDVCPWNTKAPARSPAQADVAGPWLDVVEALELTEADFRQKFRDTPLFRTKRRGLVRNAAVAAANQKLARAEPSLQALLNDPDEGIRETARWAISQITGIDCEQKQK